MNTNPSPSDLLLFISRKAVLTYFAVGIIGYSIIVLIYSNTVPHIGVKIFDRQVRGVSDENLVGRVPSNGDKVLAIGGVPIDTLPRYVNTIQNLRKLPAGSAKAVESLAKSQQPTVKVGNTLYVAVDFQPKGTGEAYRTWFVVRDHPWQKSAISIVWFAMESLIFWMGWVVFRRRPEDDSAALFFLMCIVTVGAYMGGYHWLEIAGSPPLTFIFALCAMAVPQIILHFFLIYPSPKQFVLRYPRSVLAIIYVIPAVIQVAVLWTIGNVVRGFRHGSPVESIDQYIAQLWWLIWLYLGIGGAMFICCLGSLVHTYWTSRPGIGRNQARWFLSGALVAGFFVAYSANLALRNPNDFALGAATWSMFAASLVFTFTYAVSIARYRLFYMEEVVQRGLVYLLISFMGGLCYYGLLLLAVWYSPRLASDSSQGQALLIATFVMLVLVTLSSVRTRVQTLLDRRFYREKHQLERTIRRMDIAVGRIVERDTVVQRSLFAISDLLDASAAAIYLRTRDPEQISETELPGKNGTSHRSRDYRLVRSVGPRSFPKRFVPSHPLVAGLERHQLLQTSPGLFLPGDSDAAILRKLNVELAQPFVLDEELIGFLLIGSRQQGIYSSDELEFLSGFADLTTMALHSAEMQDTLERLNEDLRSKVARVSRQKQQLLALESVDESPLLETPDDTETTGSVRVLRGRSPAMRAMAETVRKVASSSATVLIRGESGTGKSLLAEVIHRHSARASGPFVEVHCAALSSGVLESELFGHVKGAFTGAHKDKIGRFQMAHGGTLFLDEVGDISLDVQTKLLRVLQERTFEPVGSSESVTVDVRLITATHQPLEELIRKGRLREDLFYRLNVISVYFPPLRERRDDIAELAVHFLRQSAERVGKPVEGIDAEAFDRLMSYSWPGNIRELENVIERAAVLTDGPMISLADLPAELLADQVPLLAPPPRQEWRPDITIEPESPTGALSSELDRIERQRLLDALEARGGNKSKAAAMLGIPRSTFCSKLKKFGIA